MKEPIENIAEFVIHNSKHLPTSKRLRLYKDLRELIPMSDVSERLTKIIDQIKANDKACLKFSFYEK